MPQSLTGANLFPTSINVPLPGELRQATDISGPVQALLNRTEYIKNQLDVQANGMLTVGSILDLKAETGMAHGSLIYVRGYGIYRYDSTSTQPANDYGYVQPDTDPGRWINDVIKRDVFKPTSGTWTVGDVVYNALPALGEPTGWVCTTAGTPGTWRPLGFITNTTSSSATSVTLLNISQRLMSSGATTTTVTLPTLAEMDGYEGKVFSIKDTGGIRTLSNFIQFSPGTGTTIEATYIIDVPYGSISFYLDGTVWRAE